MVSIIVLIEIAELVNADGHIQINRGQHSAGKGAAHRDEVDFRVEARLEGTERLVYFREMLMGQGMINADVVAMPGELVRA